MRARSLPARAVLVLLVPACALLSPACATARGGMRAGAPELSREALVARSTASDPAARARALAELGLLDLVHPDESPGGEAGATAAAASELDRALVADPRAPLALLGAAVIAEGRGRFAVARDRWLQLLAEVERRPGGAEAPLLAAAAAAELDEILEEAPGTPAAVGQLAKLVDGPLPADVRQDLYGILLGEAQAHADARAEERWAGARGCPAAGGAPAFWQSGPYGHLPHLDLVRRGAPLSLDAAAPRALSARGCQAVVRAQGQPTGVFEEALDVIAPRPESVDARIDLDAPYGLVVDGKVAYVHDSSARFLPARAVVPLRLAGGRHRLVLRVAAGGGDVPFSLALASPETGRAAQLSFALASGATWGGAASGSPDGPAPAASPEAARGEDASAGAWPAELAPLAGYLRATIALHRMDVDAAIGHADGALTSAPRFAALLELRGELAAAEPGVPVAVAASAARRFLERAIAVEPDRVETVLRLALMDLRDEKYRDALDRLERARPLAPEDWRLAFEEFEAYRGRGWLHEADRALADAARFDPEACLPREAALDRKKERSDLEALLPAANALASCAGGAQALAGVYRDLGRPDEAAAAFAALAAESPDDPALRTQEADALLAAGRARDALPLLRAAVAFAPRDVSYAVRLANALVASGDRDAARAELERAAERVPESLDLWGALRALGEPGPLDAFRVDGRQAIREYEAARPDYSSPAVLVLDRTVERIFPTGARLTLTHNVVKVLSKDGIDEYGEVHVPDGAQVLTLHTIKADGTTREPESIAGKDSVSVPDLEVGDYVEFEYVQASSSPSAFPRGMLTDRFYFRTSDTPDDRSEILYVHPRAMRLSIDAGPGAPAPLAVALPPALAGADQAELYVARHSLPFKPEPDATSAVEWTPSVRAYTGVTLAGWRDYLRDVAYPTTRMNPSLRDGLRAILAEARVDARDPEAAARAAYAWVQEHVEQAGGISDEAAAVYAARSGNRGTLVMALLRELGIRAETVVIRPSTATAAGPRPAELDELDSAVVRAHLPSGAVLLDPRARRAPFGYLDPALRRGWGMALEGDSPAADSTALLVAGSGADAEGILARLSVPDPRETRTVSADVTVPAGGPARVEVVERLSGEAALDWRDGLDRIDPGHVRPTFEQRSLGFFFPGASLESLSFENQKDVERPLIVRYAFVAPELMVRDGAITTLKGELFPPLLSRRFVSTGERTTPLLVGPLPDTTVEVTLHLPPGARAPSLPPPVSIKGSFGSYDIAATNDGATVRIVSHLRVPLGRVEPREYAEFSAFAREVDAAAAREVAFQCCGVPAALPRPGSGG